MGGSGYQSLSFAKKSSPVPVFVDSHSDAKTLSLPAASEQPAAPSETTGMPPSAWSQVFASLFTPSWSLGLLLFVSFLLPSYQGCNGHTVYVRNIVVECKFTPGDVLTALVLIWPFSFGLIVAVGTVALSLSCNPERARWLWWSYAGLILLYALQLCVVVVGFFAALATGKADYNWDWQDILGGACFWAGSAALIALLPITRRRCQNWFNAAMWLQLSLALLAALYVSLFLPAITFAKGLLIGGKLSIAASVFLVLATLVARLDGYRVLTRARGESPWQLSLKSLMLLMSLGGIACAWVGAYVFDIWSP